jgi:hypothetical protein
MWWTWDNNCIRFVDPNMAISKGVEKIVDPWGVVVLRCCFFPMLPFSTFLPYLFGLTYL